MLYHIFAQETTLKKHKMENIEKAAKNNVITFQIGIAQMLLMPVVKTCIYAIKQHIKKHIPLM